MDLSDRMKQYEAEYREVLNFTNKDDALVVRVDGRAFHTYTKGAKVPFDRNLQEAMEGVAVDLCSEIQGSVLAYVQSDEVSVIARPFRKETSAVWFDGNVQKICSITAAIASVRMTLSSPNIFGGATRPALFDSRAFVLPREEIVNYLIWRQSDATRNSIQMLARSRFSHRDLIGKSCDEMKEMLRQNKAPWERVDPGSQRGRTVVKNRYNDIVSFTDKRTGELKSAPVVKGRWEVDASHPHFLEDRSFVESRFDATEEGSDASM